MSEPAPSEFPPPMTTPWTPDGAVAYGWRTMKANPTVIAVLLLAGVLGNFVSLIGSGISLSATLSGAKGDAMLHATLIDWGLAILNIPIQAYFTIGIWRYLLKVARGEPSGAGDLFGPGPYFSMLGALFLAAIGILLGLALCIVPGIILSLGVSLYPALVVDRRLGAFESLQESWRLTKGHKVQMFVLMLFSIGIALVGLCACGIGLIVAMPIVQLAHVYLYLKLTGQDFVEPPA